MKKVTVRWKTILTCLLIILSTSAWQEANVKTYSQSILLSVKNKPIEEVLSMIEKQTSYTFIYSYTQMEKLPLVSLFMEDPSIEKILNKLFEGRYITYTISQKYIVLKKEKEQQKKELIANIRTSS